ncbi:helix-turn-helix domain-containing protein [Novosphingobium sp. G106]|uniref:helix-turn-helix domain-containing protein n=1 Tax=Novosphingobium sp. G106 TaxID=2849500 RepID=UPI001C2DDB6F|nr:helix-turn-helix domain-containing protein [Novosphingobium sp. G106]MBV1686446.1 helix-turn-helix domain-containing protein [Novosphingobium sp. G106]
MQTKSSPAVTRVVAVLNFFLEHADQSFTLTQVAKSLHLSRATAHSILLGFVDAGYLHRQGDKSYTLALLLPSLASSARQRVSSVPMVQHELRALADEFDLIASVLFVEGEEIVVRDRVASVSHLGRAHPQSRVRYPFIPSGNVFLLPLAPEVIRDRISQIVSQPSAAMIESILNEVGYGKQHGFIAGFTTSRDKPEKNDLHLSDFASTEDQSQSFDPWYISAPVMGMRREVHFAISLSGFASPLDRAQILHIGRTLRMTCDRISQFYIERAD